jgi:hypothetical protein
MLRFGRGLCRAIADAISITETVPLPLIRAIKDNIVSRLAVSAFHAEMIVMRGQQ